jgi:hypothetical protein
LIFSDASFFFKDKSSFPLDFYDSLRMSKDKMKSQTVSGVQRTEVK